MEALGYQPSACARGLAANTSGTIAVVFPKLSGPFFSALIHGAEIAASDSGYHLLIYGASGATLDADNQTLGMLTTKVDGLIHAGKQPLKGRSWPVNGTPFAVVAKGALIYTAYFWPSYSSLSCQWVVADPFIVAITKSLQIKLGYPGQSEGANIPDHRNDSRITRIFASHGKLLP